MICEIPTCDKPVLWLKKKDMVLGGCWAKCDGILVCGGHRNRWEKHKDFQADIPIGGMRKEAAMKDIPGYRALHNRIKIERGKAKDYTCICGKVAAQWALLPTAQKTLWGMEHGKLREYSLDISDYAPMCRSCHTYMDNETRKKETK